MYRTTNEEIEAIKEERDKWFVLAVISTVISIALAGIVAFLLSYIVTTPGGML